MSIEARSRMVLPKRLRAPNSVTTQCTSPRVVTTPDPEIKSGQMREKRAALRRRRQGDDREAAPGAGGAADEVDLAADAAIEPRANRIGDHLAGEIDAQR